MTSGWSAVDTYIESHLLLKDDALDAALAASAAAGLPSIQVAPVQGKMLMLLARAVGARQILEIGTLGGYSTIWLARGMVPGGRLVTLELDSKHAAVAKENLARAGLADRGEIIVGPAIEALPSLRGPFDLVFIDAVESARAAAAAAALSTSRARRGRSSAHDADKQSNADYFDWAVKLARPGTTIVVDNVVREGEVIDAASRDEKVLGTRRLFEHVAKDARVEATAVQTVGAKKWDGFLMAIVR